MFKVGPLSALQELLFFSSPSSLYHPLMTDSRPKTSWNLSPGTRKTHTLRGHHNTDAAQTGLGLLWQIWVSGLTWVMCRLISSGIVLTKQVSVKVRNKKKGVSVFMLFFFPALIFFHIHVKHMSVISGVLQWMWHQNPGGLALWEKRFDMISENRAFLAERKALLVVVGVWEGWGVGYFYTNSRDELEGAVPCLLLNGNHCSCQQR